ncbi:hypothetical protein CLCR_11031 [Cladophialophora carrionii]|uniref:Uncharacterized protein n=1 Tax=Cladophialophora carrionii TaxID=86049 RepID=A0A1C1CZU7_9EURO|nr:hypothetical protein CLCR_11031 [Cladophialophora carrionii]
MPTPMNKGQPSRNNPYLACRATVLPLLYPVVVGESGDWSFGGASLSCVCRYRATTSRQSRRGRRTPVLAALGGMSKGAVISALGFAGCLRRLAATECAQTERQDTSWRSEAVAMFVS